MISALVRPFWVSFKGGWMEFIEFVKNTGFGGNCQLNLIVLNCGRFVRRYFFKWGVFLRAIAMC